MQGIKIENSVVTEIKKMFKEGYKAYYIAEKFGISRSMVYQKLDKTEKRPYIWRCGNEKT